MADPVSGNLYGSSSGALDDAPEPPGAGTSRAGMDYAAPPRLGAFRAAGRHTARVRFLRRFIVIGSIFGVSIIAIVAAFDPFRHLPGAISISGVGVKGTKITMDSPKISGVQEGGGPYDIAARSGIQDVTKPSIIELIGVNAHIGMADLTTTHVLADHGVYDSTGDTMMLDGDVKIANSSGYTFGLKSAMVDFKQGLLASEERTRVDLKGGYVVSDAMTVSNNGHAIAFRGNIDSSFDPPEETSDHVTGAPEVINVTPLENQP